jgi:hypothetical protein
MFFSCSHGRFETKESDDGETKACSKSIKKKREIASKCKATRELRARHLASLCAEFESLRGANGRIPRGALSQIISLNKGVYNWLTIDILKKSLKKRDYSKDQLREPIKDTAIISDLTDDKYNAQSNVGPSVNNIPPPTIVGTNALQNITNVIPKRGGHPKGATIVASRAKIEQRELLLDESTADWSKQVGASKGQMKRNELDTLIYEKK